MSIEAKRMEEGLRNTPENHKVKDEHEKETRVSVVGVGESIQQTQQEEEPLVKPKTKRIATLDAFRGLTVVVS